MFSFQKLGRGLRNPDFIYPAILVLLAFIFCYPLWWPGNLSFYGFDILKEFPPWQYMQQGPAYNQLLSDPIMGYHPPHYYMAHHYFQECLKQGYWPFWNATTIGGQPFYNYYTNPTLLIYLFLSLFSGHNLLLFGHMAVAGVFSFLFARQLGLRSFAAFTSGAAFMFCGYLLVWLEFGFVVMLAAAFPLMLLTARRLMIQPSQSNWLGLVLSCAYTANVGYILTAVYEYIFLAVFMFFTLLEFRKDISWPWLRNRCLVLAAAVFAVILLSLNFIMATIDLLVLNGQRESFPLNQLFAQTGSLSYKCLVTFLYPEAFGSQPSHIIFFPKQYPTVLYNNFSELCVFAGIFFLSLILLSWWCRRDRWVRFFWGTAIIVLLMVSIDWFYFPLAVTVPGLRQTTPLRLLYLSGFALAMLSGWGVKALCQAHARRHYMMIAAALPAILSAALLPLLLSDRGRNWLMADLAANWHYLGEQYIKLANPAYWTPPLLAITAALLIIIFLHLKQRRWKLTVMLILLSAGIVEMMIFGWRYQPVSVPSGAYPETPGLTWLRQHIGQDGPWRVAAGAEMADNFLSTCGLEDAGGYSSVCLKRYSRIFLASLWPPEAITKNVRNFKVFSFNPEFLSLCGVRYMALATSERVSKNSPLRLVYRGPDMNIYENPHVLPRTFFVNEYLPAKSPDEAFELTRQSKLIQLRTRAVLEQPPEQPVRIAGPQAPSMIPGRTVLQEYSGDRLALTVNCSEPGLVMIANNWHQWWRATVDDKPSPVLCANYFMQAVAVPAGNHRVVLEFYPWPVIYAIFISLTGWSILLLLLLYCGLRRWRRPASR